MLDYLLRRQLMSTVRREAPVWGATMIGFLIALVIGFWLLKVFFKIGFKLIGLIFTVIIGLFLLKMALWIGVAVLALGGIALLASPFQN